LKKGETTLTSNVFHFSPLKRVELPQPEIRPEVLARDGQLFVRLETTKFAKDVYLSVPGIKGRFSDNFFDLVPGRSYEVGFISDQPISMDQFKPALKIISLKDTY
jgi:beta-mannosidase